MNCSCCRVAAASNKLTAALNSHALNRSRRPCCQSARALARDVERYLRDEPVEACPPSAAYRLRKFIRKHRAILSTAAAFVAFLLGAVAVSTHLAVQAKNAKIAANKKRQEAEDAQKQTALDRDRAQRERQRTIRVWQPFYAETLTPEEAVGMILNVGRLYYALSLWATP